jgi:uncharacterized protein (TIGR02265 family)
MTRFDEAFRAPDFDGVVDVDAHIAQLPAGASTKGMFFTALIERASSAVPRAELLRRASLASDARFIPFADYSMVDNIRLTVAVAQAVFPRQPLGRALRSLGAGALDAFRASQVGRVLLDALSLDVEVLFRATPRLYRALFNFGSIEYQRIEEGRGVFTVRAMPIFIETFQVGTVEAALALTGTEGSIRVRLSSVGDGEVEVRWCAP